MQKEQQKKEKYKNVANVKSHQTRMVKPFVRGKVSFTRMRERTAKKNNALN